MGLEGEGATVLRDFWCQCQKGPALGNFPPYFRETWKLACGEEVESSSQNRQALGYNPNLTKLVVGVSQIHHKARLDSCQSQGSWHMSVYHPP